MKSRVRLYHLLLALLLLISQQIGFAHLISHGIDTERQAKLVAFSTAPETAPAKSGSVMLDKACSECLFLTHLGLALPGSLPVFQHSPSTALVVPFISVDGQYLHPPSPYLSRAPPV